MDLKRKRVTPAPEVLVRDVQGESVLLNLGSESYFGLDPVGTRMWDVLVRAPSIDAAVETLLGEYDIDADSLRRDVARFVEQLAASGLVDVRDS